MEKMQNGKLIELLSSLYNEMVSSQIEIQKVDIPKSPDKMTELSIGTKVMYINELNIKILFGIEILLDYLGEDIENLPQDLKDYYLTIQNLRKPISDSDSEEIKKFKEHIKNFNKQ